MVVINRISLINKLKEKEEEEEPFKIAKIKPLSQVGVDIGAKATGGISLPETSPADSPLTLRMLYSINLNYNPASSEPIEKIKRYEIDIKRLEKEAEIRGGLKPELYSAYEQIIGKYNKTINELNQKNQTNQPIIEDLPMSKPEDKSEPTWGDVIKYSLKSGLGQYQSSLVNILRLIQMGAVKATDAVTNVFDPNWYNPKKDILLKSLTKIVEDSDKIATESQEQAESKNWLKKLVGTGLQSTPQVVGAVIMGAGMPIPTGIATAKPTAEITARVSQMIPFGVGAAGGHARNIEKEYETLGKEAPYLSIVAGGLLGGAGEMATELPVFLRVTKLLKGGGKALVNEGAKTLIGKYGKLGIEFLKDVALQAWQEAEMEPIERAINKAVGLPQDIFKDLVKDMGTAAYGGMAMALVLGGLGGGVAGSAKVTSKTVEAVDNFIQNKGDIRETLRVIAEAQKIIPREPEAVTLGYTDKEKEYAEKYDIPLEKVKITELPKKEIVSEETIKKLEESVDKGLTAREKFEAKFKALKEAVPKEELKAEIKEPVITEELKEAINAWNNNQIYISTDKNYRWSNKVEIPEKAKSGQIVPFNKIIKQNFDNVSDFHKFAKAEKLKIEAKPSPVIEPAPTEAVKEKEPTPKEKVKKAEVKAPVTPKEKFMAKIEDAKKPAEVEPTPKAAPAIPKELEATTEKPAVVEAPVAEKATTAPVKAEGKAEPIKPPVPPSPPTTEMAKEPTGDPIAKLNELIKQAKPRRGRLETEYTKERARRIAEVERAIDEIGGEQGYIVALSKLKGQLAPSFKFAFEPVKDKLSKPEIDALYNRTFKHPYLDEWEKISAANELTKILSGELPTPKGLVLLEEIYGTDLIKSILSKRALGLKITDVLIDVANIPRAILATADMSGFLRQGIVYVVSHPVIAAKAMGKTFQFAFNSKSFEQYFKDLPKDKLYPLMRKSGLAVTDPSRVLATGREEAFISRLMQQIPIFGQVIKFAERAYVGFLNKLRVDVFKTFADEFLSKGYSPVKDRELFKATAEVVNTFTGRGSMGNLNKITPFLNTIFFSPRLITARFNALNPIWYTRQPKEIRIKALGDFAKFVAAGLTLLAIVKASGLGDVEPDFRSSDAGKIKIGNTRWDIWGGFQQWCRVFAQLITGQRKNTATGEIISLNKEEYPFTTRKEVLLRFIEGKLAPIPALINELISGAKTFEGEDITFETVAREKFIPMYIQDITDAYMDGGLGRATGAGVTAFFGVGVQTWQEKKKESIIIGKSSMSKITIPKINKIKINKISPIKVSF